MAVVNYGYFLIGIVLLFAWRLFHLIPYFKRTPYPVPGRSSVWFATFGCIYLLVTINMLLHAGTALDGYKAILPLILFIITLTNFWGESFVAPTKNYLIALGFGILIGAVSLFISNFLFLLYNLQHILSYMQLIPFLIGILIGIGVGLIIYHVLESRFPDWNTPLWHHHKFWDFINHSSLLLVIATIAFIEGMFQMKSTSLLILLTSL